MKKKIRHKKIIKTPPFEVKNLTEKDYDSFMNLSHFGAVLPFTKPKFPCSMLDVIVHFGNDRYLAGKKSGEREGSDRARDAVREAWNNFVEKIGGSRHPFFPTRLVTTKTNL